MAGPESCRATVGESHCGQQKEEEEEQDLGSWVVGSHEMGHGQSGCPWDRFHLHSGGVALLPWPQDYYSSGYYQEMDPALGPLLEKSTDGPSFMDDEAVSSCSW